MVSKIIIEHENYNGEYTRHLFEDFLKSTNLYLSGTTQFYLQDKSDTWFGRNILGKSLANLYFYNDSISANVNGCDLERVKKIFEDFTKDKKFLEFSKDKDFKINIKIEEKDC